LCRLHHPILLAQWQEGVTRVDMVKQFSFDDFMKVRHNPFAAIDKLKTVPNTASISFHNAFSPISWPFD
jgi:hypothetical protein